MNIASKQNPTSIKSFTGIPFNLTAFRIVWSFYSILNRVSHTMNFFYSSLLLGMIVLVMMGSSVFVKIYIEWSLKDNHYSRRCCSLYFVRFVKCSIVPDDTNAKANNNHQNILLRVILFLFYFNFFHFNLIKKEIFI